MTSPSSLATPLAEPKAWEVDDPDGSVLYLGSDLTLADELYRMLPIGAHLYPRPGDTIAG